MIISRKRRLMMIWNHDRDLNLDNLDPGSDDSCLTNSTHKNLFSQWLHLTQFSWTDSVHKHVQTKTIFTMVGFYPTPSISRLPWRLPDDAISAAWVAACTVHTSQVLVQSSCPMVLCGLNWSIALVQYIYQQYCLCLLTGAILHCELSIDNPHTSSTLLIILTRPHFL